MRTVKVRKTFFVETEAELDDLWDLLSGSEFQAWLSDRGMAYLEGSTGVELLDPKEAARQKKRREKVEQKRREKYLAALKKQADIGARLNAFPVAADADMEDPS